MKKKTHNIKAIDESLKVEGCTYFKTAIINQN
jgi:hypothetical protein